MSDHSSIEWTDATWGPTLGCTRVSSGCDDCYAIRTATIRAGNPNPKIAAAFAGLTTRVDGRLDWTGRVNLLPQRLDQPLRWRKPRRIFVDSQSDLFHDQVPDLFIARVWAVMALAPTHTFQLLTKRHGRMRSLLSSDRWAPLVQHALAAIADEVDAPIPAERMDDAQEWAQAPELATDRLEPLANVHLGVSVEDQRAADLRIPALLDTPAAVRWLSCEPLIGPVDLRGEWMGDRWCPQCGEWGTVEDSCGPAHDAMLASPSSGIGWVVAGGEDGPRARPMHPAWARKLRDQCFADGVPFLFKQWGAWSPMAPLVDGRFEVRGRHTLADDGTLYEPGALTYEPEGPRYREALHADHQRAQLTAMYRVGKKSAGRELDGELHDAMPERAR